MADDRITTEKKILDAAKKVFQRKGFDGSRMQEIADEAGINKALLHYYFRSKENLFETVFREAFNDLFRKIFSSIGSSLPLDEKVRYICNDYISFMQKNPYIPSFILNGIQRNPEKIAALLQSSPTPPTEILKKVKQSLEDAGLNEIDHRQFIINIISLSIFPIIAKPLLKNILNLSEEEFDAFIETRKKELPEFILRSIHAA
jgi:TetR/AcrR family transcriptional regulator